MLKDSFYKITRPTTEINEGIETRIIINKHHKVFEGHFPEQPIVPGVLQLQVLKEILEQYTSQNLLMHKAKEIKYTSFMLPDEKEVFCTINIKCLKNREIEIKAVFQNKEKVFTKIKSAYTLIH